VPLDKEITGLSRDSSTHRSHRAAGSWLAALRESFSERRNTAPDLAGRLLLEIQEQENRLNQQVGSARQRVSVLADLRMRAAEFESTRQDLAMAIGRYKILERSFGQEGVPALLIEQALPEVETRANEILDRLSDGQMSVRFMTQTEYKDKKREDLRERLEIQISDGAGHRDYETYSGRSVPGKFRVRLALSQVWPLAKGSAPNVGDR
jgi:exonuclease SbcC